MCSRLLLIPLVLLSLQGCAKPYFYQDPAYQHTPERVHVIIAADGDREKLRRVITDDYLNDVDRGVESVFNEYGLDTRVTIVRDKKNDRIKLASVNKLLRPDTNIILYPTKRLTSLNTSNGVGYQEMRYHVHLYDVAMKKEVWHTKLNCFGRYVYVWGENDAKVLAEAILKSLEYSKILPADNVNMEKLDYKSCLWSKTPDTPLPLPE